MNTKTATQGLTTKSGNKQKRQHGETNYTNLLKQEAKQVAPEKFQPNSNTRKKPCIDKGKILFSFNLICK